MMPPFSFLKPRSTATPVATLSITPPSASFIPLWSSGGNAPGTADDAVSAVTTSPLSITTSLPETRSTAVTAIGIFNCENFVPPRK